MMGGENKDGGFPGFSSQTMLGGITSRVHIDKYSTEELKKMWSENCCRMMKGYDPHEPATIGEPGLLCVIMPALRIKDWDHAYPEMDFGEIGGVKE